ncbi:MAG: hypothetical protein KMY53_16045 [Desulfarculus sp.]|nr:hypothetical protein [Pseudomonadota bacterium]MBV1715473.1 hypothetical protein [Desulfarculus sp.]MBU4576221.1 hypothetical protein [Pseudomonadota bacterium]MBU4599259.1 hypothetical protein [Pseudomonadota bacterium]MBV1739680.1 hypothetical protein [Desulfarculus sp.]
MDAQEKLFADYAVGSGDHHEVSFDEEPKVVLKPKLGGAWVQAWIWVG